MPTRFALCISLTVAVLAAPATALAADTVVPSSVAASTTVPAGGSSTLTLRCPGTAVALNAAVTRRGAGVTVRRSIPGAGSGDWSFRLSAAPGARRRGARAVLRCVRLRVSGVRLFVATRRPPAMSVAAGASTEQELRCARGFVPTGHGLDRTSPNVALAAARPTSRGWSFRVENTGGTSARARLSVRSLQRSVSAGGRGQLDFALGRRSFSDAVGRRPGSSGTVTHTCAGDRFSVATGHSVDPAGRIVVTGGGPAGLRSGRWTFRRATAGDVMQTHLVCLGRHTQFG
jgi:hypothetical protein